MLSLRSTLGDLQLAASAATGGTMTSLQKGGNGPVTGENVDVAVRWSAGPRGPHIQPVAFLLATAGRVRSNSDIVYGGKPVSADGSVTMSIPTTSRSGVGLETHFAIQLAAVPAHIQTVAVAVASPEEGRIPLGSLADLRITVAAGETTDFVVPVVGATETAMTLGELYRRDGRWKFRAVGQGFSGGLGPLALSFGITIPPTLQPSDSHPAPERAKSAPPVQPPGQPPAAPPRLAKVSLTKSAPVIDLTKKATGYGEVRVNLNWNKGTQGGFRSLFSKAWERSILT